MMCIISSITMSYEVGIFYCSQFTNEETKSRSLVVFPGYIAKKLQSLKLNPDIYNDKADAFPIVPK